MKPRKKGNMFEICYRCPGYEKPFLERFPTYEAANLRAAQIEYERQLGVFTPPKKIVSNKPIQRFVTVGSLMDEYVEVYGLNHWGDSYLSDCRHRIEHYIKPYIGDIALKDLTAHDLDVYYNSLLDKPAIVLKGHRKTDAKITASVVERIHTLLRSALNQAVRWDYIPSNPAMRVSPPQYKSKTTDVWTPEQAQYAIEHCTDSRLKTAMTLAIACSMRIGEVLGLTWDCMDISEEAIESAESRVYINKELKRCRKESLSDLEKRNRSKVIMEFKEWKLTESSTTLVLKTPKTDSSIRTVYLPKSVAHLLQREKETQEQTKRQMGKAYTDYNLVIAHDDGRPYEERQIMDMLHSLIKKENLPPVVFHSLRHCSTSLKLQLSGGDIKAVQGDTGHAQSRMVTDLYAHINNESRRTLAQKMDEKFFCKDSAAKNETDDGVVQACEFLKANPNLANLLIGILQAQKAN